MKNTMIQVRTDNFEGPLDLLIHLIEKKQMRIDEINISKIIDDYLEYINKEENFLLKNKVDFLVLATELVEIKAYSVLDKKKKDEKIEDLEKRIIEYKFFKSISEVFIKKEKEHNIPYQSRAEGEIIQSINDFDFSKLTRDELFNSIKKIIEKDIKKKEKMNIHVIEEYTLEDARDDIILTFKNNNNKFRHDMIFNKKMSNEKLVSLFLVILDMFKNAEIDILIEDDFFYLENINL